jgi:hypothetical protein
MLDARTRYQETDEDIADARGYGTPSVQDSAWVGQDAPGFVCKGSPQWVDPRPPSFKISIQCNIEGHERRIPMVLQLPLATLGSIVLDDEDVENPQVVTVWFGEWSRRWGGG